jgi:SAM-dependent methyltransferase
METPGPATHEAYTPGYSDNATGLMARRTLATHGAFLTPYLRPGLDVLDVGCGPGSITLDIAEIVKPGNVVGVDLEPTQLEVARTAARNRGATGVRFEPASAYELPFQDDSFDLGFAHAVLEHLQAPVIALAELRRVVRPGGRVALRSPDWGGFVIGPTSSSIDAAVAAYRSLQVRNGGDVVVGRKLGGLLRRSEFVDVVVTANFEVYPSPDLIGEYLALQLEGAGETNSSEAFRQWASDPDALFAQAWFEATGVVA